MRIIICGAGRVGSEVAKLLAIEKHEITVIDSNRMLVEKLADESDVKAICEDASKPHVLDKAGAAEVDVIIAVTNSDSLNILICQVAKYLFAVPRLIARIRDQNYLLHEYKEKLYGKNGFDIDTIISPEFEVAKSILTSLEVPGVSNNFPFVDEKIRLISLRVPAYSALDGLSISRLKVLTDPISYKLIGISRENIFQDSFDEHFIIEAGDEIYLITESIFLFKLMNKFGYYTEKAKQYCLIGAGNIGYSLAKHLSKNTDFNIKVIEHSIEKATKLASMIPECLVISGDALDYQIIEEVNYASCDFVISVTNDDKVNILTSILAKQLGAKQVVTLINNNHLYGKIVGTLGLDITINPSDITISSILSYINQSQNTIKRVYSIADSQREILEIQAKNTKIVGKSIINLDLGEDAKIVSIIRNNSMISIDYDTNITNDDQIILACLPGTFKRFEDLFSLSIEYIKKRVYK